jgi:hypothetical protein
MGRRGPSGFSGLDAEGQTGVRLELVKLRMALEEAPRRAGLGRSFRVRRHRVAVDFHAVIFVDDGMALGVGLAAHVLRIAVGHPVRHAC